MFTPFSSPEPVVSWSRGRETRGQLQIKPSGSGDENVFTLHRIAFAPARRKLYRIGFPDLL